MVNFLRKLFIKNYNDLKNENVRTSHGKLAAAFGIVTNLVLFGIKLLAGILASSIAIIADSINNFADMASSVVTLVGFKLASKPADKEHPYGHERIEYIAGLIVAIVVLFIGGMLGVSSVKKIINYTPEAVEGYVYYITIGILSASILLKLWQSYVNSKIGKLIDSVALKATAVDSRNDCITTLTVLIGTIVLLFFKEIPFSLDGVLGVCVSLFIVWSGFGLIKETANPLIGSQVSKEFVDMVLASIKKYPVVLGVHDVVCHMYGPSRCFMTLHAEVDSKGNIIDIHDTIDEIEQEIRNTYNIELTIHMDPVDTSSEVLTLKNEVISVVNSISPLLKIHDFRVVRKLSKNTLLFDVVVPYDFNMTHEEIKNKIDELMNKEGLYNFIIQFDNDYIGE